MTNKRICFVTTTSVTIKSFLIGQLEYFYMRGYEVTVICNNDLQLAKSLPSYINYKPVEMVRGVNSANAIRCIYQLYKIFKKENFDIVQYSTPNAALYTSVAAWLARVPVRLYCQWGIRYVGFEGWKRQFFKLLEKAVCTLSTYIEPDSLGNLNFSFREKLYKPRKSRVIWNGSANGVDLVKFDISKKCYWNKLIRKQYNIQPDELVIGFIGRLDKDKGINELLQAFKKISDEYQNCKLLIIGPDDKVEGLEPEIYKWSKSFDSVIYTGFTTQVEKFIAAMDLFVLPSYREGFGSVVIEAEAMGVPVIVTDIPGPVDAMQPGITGLTVPKGSVQPLVDAMEQMILNPKEREEMGKNAFNFARTNFAQEKLWDYILEDRDRLCNTLILSQREKLDA
ncbi:glycosyltransferase family 4 protein [Evansella clarkii]|uniref:glycosyltransferase family 4 protein n=1 Tax=Evansella clarkii TaxID=79879 RepID=UPI0009971E3F|nr:glycosyltransferase family 4 protein [Evansella clarkii]